MTRLNEVPRQERTAQKALPTKKRLGGDGFIATEGGLDLSGRDGAFAANAPVVAAEFDNRGGRSVVGFSSIEDERNAIAELGENFDAAAAGGRTRNVGAGPGKRNTEFGDEVRDDRAVRPAKSDAPGVGGDLEGKAVRGVDDHSERAGPAGVGKTIEIIGKIAGENRSVNERIDEDGESATLGASLDAENLFDRREINGISSECVERVRRNGDDRAAIQPTGGVAEDTWIRIGGINLQYLGRQ